MNHKPKKRAAEKSFQNLLTRKICVGVLLRRSSDFPLFREAFDVDFGRCLYIIFET